jgi:triacylglycerol lipase
MTMHPIGTHPTVQLRRMIHAVLTVVLIAVSAAITVPSVTSTAVARADEGQDNDASWHVEGAEFEPSWLDPAGVLHDMSFYTPPDPLPPGQPGDLIRTEPSRLVFEPSGRVWFRGTGTRIMYHSTDAQGRPVAVTGTYIEPDNPWPGNGPRPLIAYGAIPTGMGEQCAVSKMLNQGIHASTATGFDVMINFDQGFIGTLVARGFAVVITDGVGFGVVGPMEPQFLNRVAEGTALLDATRAAMKLPDTSLDPHGPVAFRGWLSGGKAALSAAEQAGSYAPELNVVGTSATATPTDLAVLVPVFDGNFLAGGIGWTLRGIFASYPETYQAIWDLLTPRGIEMLANTGRQCMVQMGIDYMFRHSSFWFKQDPNELVKVDPIKSVLALQRVGNVKPTGPVRIDHNRWDSFGPYESTRQTALDYCTKGGDVTFWTNEQPPLFNKLNVNALLSPLVDGERDIAWLTDRFNGVPTTPNCGEF